MKDTLLRCLFVMIIMVIGVLFFLGKIRYATNPLVRRIAVERFIEKVKHDRSVDPEYFWEFRDFLSATSARFTPEHVSTGGDFLTWSTYYVRSADRIDEGTLPALASHSSQEPTIVYEDATSRITRAGTTVTIDFVKTLDEMRRANGYIGIYKIDLSPLTDKKWVSRTTITL